MSTNACGQEKRIGKRTVRAATESMTVVPDAPGMFRVYSGETAVYTVDLGSGACECPDAEYNEPESGCKHLRRVEMEAGIREIPDLGRRTDVEIMVAAREAREEPEPEPEPITVADAKPARRVMADGGVVLEDAETTDADGDSCDCEHFDVGELACAECYIFDGIKEVPDR